MIKYGAFVKGRFIIKHGGGMFVIPIIQGVKRLSLGIINADIPLKGAYSANKIPVNVEVDASFKISSKENEQRIAAEALLDARPEGIRKLASEIITGELRAAIATMTVDQINSNREILKKTVEDNVESELNKIGLDLTNLNLRSIVDGAGVLDEMGKKSASEITNQAKVDVAVQDKIGRTKSAELEAETVEAENLSETKKAVSDRAKQTAIGEAEAKKELAIESAQIEAEKVAEVRKRVAQKEVYESEVETAKKKGDLELANRTATEIVAKKIENEKELLDRENELLLQEKTNKTTLSIQEKTNDTRLKIDRETSENELVVAENKAKAIKITAEAESEATKLKAAAEAELLALPKEREADAIEKLNQALASQDDKVTTFLIQKEVIKIMPEMVRAQAEAISKVGFDKITVIAGDGSKDGGQGAITNTIGDIMKSMPMMVMGLDMVKSVMKTVDGEEAKPKQQQLTDFTPNDKKSSYGNYQV